MYGETDVMRRRVRQLREQGVDIRRLADHLVGQTDRIPWTGRAGDAMRERARERATALRECAHRYESAADALDRHADDVDHLKDTIGQRERKAGALIAEEAVPAGFTPPPSGHRDWLSVELPGL